MILRLTAVHKFHIQKIPCIHLTRTIAITCESPCMRQSPEDAEADAAGTVTGLLRAFTIRAGIQDDIGMSAGCNGNPRISAKHRTLVPHLYTSKRSVFGSIFQTDNLHNCL